MADTRDPRISLPVNLTSIQDPCGDNPFPAGNPRFGIWAEATRQAQEDLLRFQSDLLQRMNAIAPDSDYEDKFYWLWIENFTGTFDVWAGRGISVLGTDEDAQAYDKWIADFLVGVLALAWGSCPECYPKERLNRELKYQLMPRLLHWKGQARRHLRLTIEAGNRQDETDPNRIDNAPAGPELSLRQADSRQPASVAGVPVENSLAVGEPVHVSNPRAVRRDPRTAEIDRTLREIAGARPASHEEVFRSLDGRAPLPRAKPFAGSGGWLAGFQRDRRGAQAWLSKAWSRLNLPPFPRGPKK